MRSSRASGRRWASTRADDLRDWDDFARLPFTRKSELVEDQAAPPPFGSNLTYPLDRYVRIHQTSGTTGAPLRWLDTAESWDWWLRCWGFVLRGAGLGPGDRIFFPVLVRALRRASGPASRARGRWARWRFRAAARTPPSAWPRWRRSGSPRSAARPPTRSTSPSPRASAGSTSRRLGVRTTVHAGEPGAGIPSVRARIEDALGRARL